MFCIRLDNEDRIIIINFFISFHKGYDVILYGKTYPLVGLKLK
uniref:Translation initiation factor 1 n=1 Tax=Silene aprica TaxID=54820 RepID=A0A411JYI1_9CARY|nr:translation initiation factor 1 [Silene aprica]QBC70089.1 translation initiation factor 1 [Silene aprica]